MSDFRESSDKFPWIPFFHPSDEGVTSVDSATTELLLAIRRGEISATPPTLPRVVGGSWNNIDFDGLETSWERQGDNLTLVAASSKAQGRLPLNQHFGVINLPASFTLESGGTLEARFGHVLSRTSLTLDSWIWHEQSQGHLWIAPIDVAFEEGNLTLEVDRDSGETRNLRLRGANILYVLRLQTGSHVLAVDTEGRGLNLSTFAADFMALEFVLGRTIELKELVAVAADGKVVGAANPSFGGLCPGERRAPIPGRHEVYALTGEHIKEPGWNAVFFEKLAARLHADGADSPLYVPMATYMDSLAGRYHTRYLAAQVGLESFARAILIGCGEDPGPTRTRVRRALDRFALVLPEDDLKSELGGRNDIVHEFRMVRNESTASATELQGRLTFVQTLLIALVAKHIGFDGPICGGGRKNGRPTVPNWWPERVADAPEAQHHFVAIDPSFLSELEERQDIGGGDGTEQGTL